MKLSELFRTAVTALSSNLLRSALTTLGIMIGVASVIAMVAVTEGAKSEVDRQIGALGANVLQVQSGSSRVRGRWAGANTKSPLSEADIAAIEKTVDGIAAISGNLSNVGTVVSQASNWLTSIEGVNEQYLTIRDWHLKTGRFFDESEARTGRRVAVLGRSAAMRLFGDQDPTGQTVRILNVPFEVIGLLQAKGQSNSGRDLDDVVFVPAVASRASIANEKKTTPNEVGKIFIKAVHASQLRQLKIDVEQLLRERRRLAPGMEDDFFVRDLTEYMRTRTATQNTLGVLLGATGAISLLVGGIGIMNIMLVSVTERTREIGLRIAVGAEPRDILAQFLTESVVLCTIGGMAGAVAGIVATVTIANWAAWPALVTMDVVLMSVSAAALTGLLFGFLPANRAAHLDPIQALRRE